MLTIVFSNRYRTLRETLLHAITREARAPFESTPVIAPSAAIRRDLELAMAEKFGICANVQFAYLGSWIWRQIGKLTPMPPDSPLMPEHLIWRILKIFDDRPFVQSQPRLAAYLEQADAVMRYELALKSAALFEQTVTYRPDWIEAWGANKFVCLPGGTRQTALDLRWQSALWRRVLHEVGGERHLVAAMGRLAHVDHDAAVSALRPSGAVHLFCPSAIAPLHMDILNTLGQWMDIHLYAQNPCREYWFDIVDRKRLSHLAADERADHHETGNRLLAAWGKQTQSMIDLLFERTDLSGDEHSIFLSNAEENRSSLLAQLQDAILDLHELPPRGISLRENDRSIEVHACHSLTRELEVLQDQLLALFAGEHAPKPDEVLVVMPNLEQGAPLVDAVFGTAAPPRRIPYTITGRKHVRSNEIAAALTELLSLASSRVSASAACQLLQQPVIAQRFALERTSLESVHDWLSSSGIRWGLDAAHRDRIGLPATPAHTFDEGLHRLFLGYALPSDTSAPFGGRLPAGDAEGAAAAALGSLNEFLRQLGRLERALAAPQSPQQWEALLTGALDTFMLPLGNQMDDWREVRQHIHALCTAMREGSGDHPIAREVLQHALNAALDDPARGGVPTGTVTFTSMSSLRHLPYRVICVIGMNDGAFPTSIQPPEFDLIAHSPRRGDRQRRDDERNLFLDLLLSAGERFYLSYTGRSVRDNAPLTPSVLIDELLDYATAAIEGDPAAVRKRLLVEHPLQPFSSQYFVQGGDPRFASSNREYYEALRAQAESPLPCAAADITEDDEDIDEGLASARPFFDPPRLPEPDESWRQVTIDQLLRFFRNPSRFLLRERLGIVFADVQEELQDDEPFLPDRETRKMLAERLLPLCLQGLDEAQLLALASAGTEFPAGELGDALLREEVAGLRSYADTLRQALSAPCLPPVSATLDFNLDGEHWALAGTLNELRASGQLAYRYQDAQAADYLDAWIRHLFLNAVAPPDVRCETVWHARDGIFSLSPIDDAQQELAHLIDLYRTGLAHPLRFYPRSAWAFATSGRDQDEAEKVWRNPGGTRGESRNPAYRQALRGVSVPLDDEFVACADTVFGRLNRLINGDPS